MLYTGAGISECVLRCSVNLTKEEVSENVHRALAELIALYPTDSEFAVTLTCNCILQGEENGRDSFSYWFGQDYGAKEDDYQESSPIYLVRAHTDVRKVPLSYPKESFEALFSRGFSQSAVFVHSLTHTVYIFRHLLRNFLADKVSPGSVHTTLFSE